MPLRLGLAVLSTVLLLLGTSAASSLQFSGTGSGDIDRVKITIDDVNVTSGEVWPADVGSQDFTIEFWMKALASENTASAVSCGNNINWINGNVLIDRDRFNQDRKFGVSVAGGVIVFGVSGDGTGDLTICGSSNVLDGFWHHIAAQRRRSDGEMSLYVDGVREAIADGPDGDVSYPDNGIPGNFCGGPCDNSDPFLVIAAEKHDAGPSFPSFSGWIDEIRISGVLRYAGASTSIPNAPFVTDANTLALYHLDEGAGTVAGDSSGHPDGPSHGDIRVGGSPGAPAWSPDTPFSVIPPATPAASFAWLAVMIVVITVSTLLRIARRAKSS